MSISCSCDYGDSDFAWYWEKADVKKPLSTKRSRKCCCCKTKIKVGDDAQELYRHRGPANDVEEDIYGDEVPLASWYMCDDCADLSDALDKRNVCYDINEPMEIQAREYNEIARVLNC